MTITNHEAACCLLSAAQEILRFEDLDGVDHAYLSADLSMPYCDHDALVVQEQVPSFVHPSQIADSGNYEDRNVVSYEVFRLMIVRGSGPLPNPGDPCPSSIYGDCESSASPSTISGHHRMLSEESAALRKALLPAWCQCMLERHRRPAHLPRWLVETEILPGEGRFSGTIFTVAAALD